MGLRSLRSGCYCDPSVTPQHVPAKRPPHGHPGSEFLLWWDSSCLPITSSCCVILTPATPCTLRTCVADLLKVLQTGGRLITAIQITSVLGLPKSLFRFFCTISRKNRNKLFNQPHTDNCPFLSMSCSHFWPPDSSHLSSSSIF